ncbi:hypothetical protein [Chitinophaga sp.]|uniref:hypothetical protein n=1 Tax=Chitinophaga sp. TaxID=1869181 RepID=UPI0026333B0C|nr:hypothetical protein [uncultured Chitinophaga sp.]
MKVTFILPACALALALVLHGCQKDPHPPADNLECRITKISGILGISYLPDSFIFTYNGKGDPVSITRSVIGTSSPNYYFRYDQRGRLTDFYGVYNDHSVFDTWHRYHHDHKNRIVVDTTYAFGDISPDYRPIPAAGRTELDVRNISTYAYDHQNRIIRSTDTYGRPFVYMIRLYSYDAAGNLVKIEEQVDGYSNFITISGYDQQISYRRLHPIWQFLDRDFSQNNSLPVTTYNQHGLPAKISLNSHQTGVFATEPFTSAEFEYSCQYHYKAIYPLIR